MTEIELTTGDVTPPRFAQPPLVDAGETSMRVRVSTSEPATLHWAISYDNVAAEYRYQLLGFKTSSLSTSQVLELSQATAATEAGGAYSSRVAAVPARRLHQEAVENGTVLPEDGPVVAWGQWEVSDANEVVDVEITPPCFSDTVMCTEHTDSLNPETQYKVWCHCNLMCQLVSCSQQLHPPGSVSRRNVSTWWPSDHMDPG